MYKIGVSIGEYLEDDIFHREYGGMGYSDNKPDSEGIKVYKKMNIPRNQKFGVLLRHWNIDSKNKGKPDGVHMEAYVDEKNNGRREKYIEVNDVGQLKDGHKSLEPIIKPNYTQKVQTRLGEAKPKWKQNIESCTMAPINFEKNKEFVSWRVKTM